MMAPRPAHLAASHFSCVASMLSLTMLHLLLQMGCSPWWPWCCCCGWHGCAGGREGESGRMPRRRCRQAAFLFCGCGCGIWGVSLPEDRGICWICVQYQVLPTSVDDLPAATMSRMRHAWQPTLARQLPAPIVFQVRGAGQHQPLP